MNNYHKRRRKALKRYYKNRPTKPTIAPDGTPLEVQP